MIVPANHNLSRRDRRDFLANVGKGMLVASVGSSLAFDLGLCPANAAEWDDVLTFGDMEPLVCLMQETPLDKFQATIVQKLKSGTDMKTLVAAAALANARTFGGQDYDGYHTFMALGPAWEMSKELPEAQRALPILKVLYRNTHRIQGHGGRDHDVLHVVEPASIASNSDGGTLLQEATRAADFERAEAVFAALATGPVGEAYNHLQYSVQDEIDVHRIVLAWRAWMMLGITGQEHAHTLLRQSVRFCVDTEQSMKQNHRQPSEIRGLLPKLLSNYGLLEKPAGSRDPGDAWVGQMCQTLFSSKRAQAAEAVAAALAEGISPEIIGEAMSLASNQLLLHDPGRRAEQSSADKPKGSVHGASVGVHASDSANAWRNIARVSNPRNMAASLIVGAYHTADQFGHVGSEPLGYEALSQELPSDSPDELLKAVDNAVRAGDQIGAAAAVYRYGQQGHPAQDAFRVLLQFAVSEDGALHAEKYYRTVSEEFAATRPALRWRQLIGLARVSASEYGHPAPGQLEARQLLGV